MANFLKDRKQRVALNIQHPSRVDVEAGAPQGSILGALLFKIYMDDLSGNLVSKLKLFADDTYLFFNNTW